MSDSDFMKYNHAIAVLSRKNTKARKNLENEMRRSDFLANMCIDLCDHLDEHEMELPQHILKRMNEFVLSASKRKKSIFDIIFDMENNNDE